MRSWANAQGTLTVNAILVPVPNGDVSAAAKEFEDWPDVGRSLVTSFGNAYSRALTQSTNVECNHSGQPITRDMKRMLIQFRVDVACATTPAPTMLRALVLTVLTKSGQVMIRIDTQPEANAEADDVAAMMWRTLSVTDDQRVQFSAFRLSDYSLINPAALVGEFVGSVLGGTLFGALLAILFMRVGMNPLFSLVIAQMFLVVVRLVGNEHDGIWEFDWVTSVLPGIISVVILRGWAGRYRDKRAAKAQATPK